MSIIKSIKQVLGLGPAAENHFWDGSVPNQLSLKRGTPDAPGSTVMQVVDGKVAALASGQTWQDVKASRAFATDYTNNTGLPITVRVSGEGTVATSSAQLIPTVGGVALPKNMIYAVAANAGWMVTAQFVVPAGATYRVDAVQAALTPITAGWSELR
jgi:hypothetical protein